MDFKHSLVCNRKDYNGYLKLRDFFVAKSRSDSTTRPEQIELVSFSQ